MQISLNVIHVACDWRPHGYNLHATGGHRGTTYMRLAASHMQILHALRTVQSKVASFLQAHCENNYLNYKMKALFKNLRIYACAF
jgi:hypothetical protein